MEGTESPKPKRTSARVQRILKKREPQLVETTKKCIVMKGHHTSQTITDVLQDISKLLKPNCVNFSRKNDVLPFEDVNSVEFFCQKNDCAMFIIGSHTKKRPNNLVIGRTFDGHVLDMIELGVNQYQSIVSFPGMKKSVGSKPMLAFLGSQWETDALYGRLQSLFLDLFRGTKFDKLALQGIDHVLSFTVVDGTVYFRAFAVALKKPAVPSSKVPDAHLIPMGPFLDLSVRRHQLASDDMWKTACKQPKGVVAPKVKNVSRNSLGDTVGRIHVKKQNLDGLGGRRVNALRSNKRSAALIAEQNDTNADNSSSSKKFKM